MPSAKNCKNFRTEKLMNDSQMLFQNFPKKKGISKLAPFSAKQTFSTKKKRFITKSLHVLKPKGSGYEFVRYEIISRRSSKAKKAH